MVEGDEDREKIVGRAAYRKAWQAASNWSANMKAGEGW
jgi:hypothetical protein